MKTKISRILSLCLFGLLLSLSAFGCQKQAESEPMYRLTRLIGGGSYEDSSAPREASVTFEGVTYTGCTMKQKRITEDDLPGTAMKLRTKACRC